MKNLALGILGVAVLIAAGFFLSQQFSSKQQPQETTSLPTPTQQEQASTPAAETQPETGEVMVTVTTAGFEPKTVTVAAGTKVTWTNKSGGISNVSSAIHPTHLVYPPLNLGNIAVGGNASLVFDKAGTYKYHNHLNPSQTGTMVVE